MYNYLNCVADFNSIPSQAFLFRPTYSGDPYLPDDYKRYQGEQFRRLLFEGWAQGTYTPHENKKLEEFREYLDKNKIVLDQRWDNAWRLRFLHSTKFKFEDTVRDMDQFIGYMGRVQELSFTHNVAKNLRQGLFYIVGRDCHYRPILVFNAQKIIQSGISEEECLETQVYFFEYVMRHCFIPGQVESWVALIDSAYQGFFSLVGALKKSFEFLSNTYRMRLYCCYNVRINMPIRLVWGIVQKFLDSETVNKIHLVEDQIPEKLFTHCHRSQVEKRFGGTLPDIEEGHFWPPPSEVSKEYAVSTQPVIMMTREQYTKFHKSKVLYDTKIQEQLLIRDEPIQNRQNSQKRLIRSMERLFQRELQQTQEQKVDISTPLSTLQKLKPVLSYRNLLTKQSTKGEKQKD